MNIGTQAERLEEKARVSSNAHTERTKIKKVLNLVNLRTAYKLPRFTQK